MTDKPLSKRAQELLARLRQGRFYKVGASDTPRAMAELEESGLVGKMGRAEVISLCYVHKDHTPFVPDRAPDEPTDENPFDPWRPVDTAPRDRTLIDMMRDGTRWTDCHFEPRYNCFVRVHGYPSVTSVFRPQPTHWMPRPGGLLDPYTGGTTGKAEGQ